MSASRIISTRRSGVPETRSPDIPFEKHTIDIGANETCAWADINGDGRLDIVSGENWFEAPTWRKNRFRTLHFTNNYIDAFSDPQSKICEANQKIRINPLNPVNPRSHPL